MENLRLLVRKVLEEQKRDRCLRIADRKYDKPSAYKSGAVVRCRKGDIWKDLKEVGEANLKPYKWEEVDAEGYYVYTRFITDSETQYDVDIHSTVYYPEGQMESRPALEIEFSAKPKGVEDSSSKIVVNKGEMYKVMSTIADIVKKYAKKAKAQAIIYSPSKKSSEENFGTQRDNLYRAFISKAFPGTTFKQSGDDITAVLPNNTGDHDKQEETISFKGPEGGIDNIKNYILAVDKVEDFQEAESLHKWFSRKGAKGSTSGWVDCNAPDGKGGYKACGRQKGEKRSKYPACRPTPSACKDKGKGKTWGKTK